MEMSDIFGSARAQNGLNQADIEKSIESTKALAIGMRKDKMAKSIISIYNAAKELERLVELKDRRYKFKMYKRCFTGSAAVRAMVNSGICSNKEEAIKTGNLLLSAGYISPVSDVEMFKEEFSFYTFVSEKRMTKQEKESSIHRLAVSLTGGYVMNREGQLMIKVTEQHLLGVDIVKGPLSRTKRRLVQISGGYLTIWDDDRIQKLRLVPLSTVVAIEYDEFDSADFSFTCLEDDIESTYFLRSHASADLWVRHLVVETLNAAQVVENSITMLLRDETTEGINPERFEELLQKAVVLWTVLDFPCKREGIAVSASEAKKRLHAWVSLTRENGEMSEPLNETVTDRQMERIRTSMDGEQNLLDEDDSATSRNLGTANSSQETSLGKDDDDEEDSAWVVAKEEGENGTSWVEEERHFGTDLSNNSSSSKLFNALDEIREHTEELLYFLMMDKESPNNSFAVSLEKEMELASMEMRDSRRAQDALPEDLIFSTSSDQRNSSRAKQKTLSRTGSRTQMRKRKGRSRSTKRRMGSTRPRSSTSRTSRSRLSLSSLGGSTKRQPKTITSTAAKQRQEYLKKRKHQSMSMEDFQQAFKDVVVAAPTEDDI